MDIKAQSLYQELQMMSAQARVESMPTPITPQTNASQSFGDMLSSAIQNVNGMQMDAKAVTNRFEMGDPSLSLADVMIAKEKSGIAFEATVQVRNKVLDAYKTIMNMSV
jgi:flagellar hook-basal body complex protein FliE